MRYADDCRVFVQSRKSGERVMVRLTKFIEGKLKLKINQTKSAVDRAWKRAFLGYSFSENGMKVLAVKSCKRFKDKVRLSTRKGGGSLSQRLERLNSYLQGWKNYFKEVENVEVFQSLDSWIRRRLRSLLWCQWKTFSKRHAVLRKRGMKKDLTRRTAASGKGY